MSWYLEVCSRTGKKISGYGSVEMMPNDYYRLQGTHKSARQIAFFIKNFKMKYDVTGELTKKVRCELKQLCKKGNYIKCS